MSTVRGRDSDKLTTTYMSRICIYVSRFLLLYSDAKNKKKQSTQYTVWFQFYELLHMNWFNGLVLLCKSVRD